MMWQHIIYDYTAMIVFDPNGDVAEQVAKFKEHASGLRSQKLIYIEPSLSTTDFPVINPLDLPNV